MYQSRERAVMFCPKDCLRLIQVTAQDGDISFDMALWTYQLDCAGITLGQRLHILHHRSFVHAAAFFIKEHRVFGENIS